MGAVVDHGILVREVKGKKKLILGEEALLVPLHLKKHSLHTKIP